MELNFGDVKMDSGFDPIPAGWYPACITKLEFKPTKAGTGKYLSVEFTITGDEYAKRKVFNMYNLENPNPKAVEIAMQQLKALLIETGCDESKLASINEQQLVELLINKQVGIRLKIQVSQEYGDKNVIVGYKANAGSSPNGEIPDGNVPF